MTARLIVGLGNPGSRYANNRHNIGFRCVEALARAHGLAFSQRYAHSYVARGQILGTEAVLAKPRTYMNRSGEAVQGLLARQRIRPADMVVVYDDMDLPLGRIRLRRGQPVRRNHFQRYRSLCPPSLLIEAEIDNDTV